MSIFNQQKLRLSEKGLNDFRTFFSIFMNAHERVGIYGIFDKYESTYINMATPGFLTIFNLFLTIFNDFCAII